MHWIYILGSFVLVIGFFVLTGMRPKGGRPASGTHLMTAARIVLVIFVVLLAIAYFSSV
jgi:hypothetical protein